MKINSKNRGFVRGTLVVMADGREKPIEQIRPGDYVLSFNEFDADAPLEPRQVIDTFSRVDSSVLEVKAGESTLLVAKDQMFIGPNNDWKEVYNHSLVVDRNGQSLEYEVSKVGRGKHQIYDITVEDNHSLIANGIRVHNLEGALGGKADASAYGGGNSDPGKSVRDGDTISGKSGSENNAGSVARSNERNSNYMGGGGPQPSKSPGSGRARDGNDGNSFSNNNSRRGNDGGNGDGGNRFVNNGSRGRKKVSKKHSSRYYQEPGPVQPSSASVSSKLIDSVYETAQILDELIAALDPLSLTASKVTVQTGVDTMFSHANAFLGTIFAAEMSTYDKMELITSIQNIMTNTAAIRKPFEETVVSSAGKSTALTQLAMVQIYCVKVKATLDAYTTQDTKGNLDVLVDDRPVSKKKNRKPQSKRSSNGTYQYGGGGGSDRDADSRFGTGRTNNSGGNKNLGGNTKSTSPGTTTRGTTKSSGRADRDQQSQKPVGNTNTSTGPNAYNKGGGFSTGPGTKTPTTSTMSSKLTSV